MSDIKIVTDNHLLGTINYNVLNKYSQWYHKLVAHQDMGDDLSNITINIDDI